jgi:drug/metabolite transporter (DMT)-like permease
MTRRSAAGISIQSVAGAAFTASPGDRTFAGVGVFGGVGGAAATSMAAAVNNRILRINFSPLPLL